MKNKQAIILCSGGLDSTTTAYYVRKKMSYKKIKILFFNYGQKSLNAEKKCSVNCAKNLGASFEEIKLEWLNKISNSLINKPGKIRKMNKKDLKDTSKESKKYYVPCRNTLFLVYALASAEDDFIKNKIKSDIFVGFKCEGKESYPDTTKKFVEIMNLLGKKGCSGKFKIIAPLINKDKEDIVLLGKKLGIDFKNTFSCYVDDKEHCGTCLACRLRQAGFYWSGIKDPTKYKNN